ncbi:MAG TPA: PepSY-associated TM helix domain-containing protein [Planctomycetota bacterium]|jgi:uncharacterized iron-regulated membrane protein|nr:PepSY-associated TM helix domain-containing protein [Planctomycetota bacterium]
MMRFFSARRQRTYHRWVSALIALPLLVITVTGLLLLLKKQIPAIQPPTAQGHTGSPTVTLEAILEAARSVPEFQVTDWKDLARLDYRPKDGVFKLQSRANLLELQVDAGTAEVLQMATRRSDFIEDLHTGSFFSDAFRFLVTLPTGLLLLFLWVSGLTLFFAPWKRRRQRTSDVPSESQSRGKL